MNKPVESSLVGAVDDNAARERWEREHRAGVGETVGVREIVGRTIERRRDRDTARRARSVGRDVERFVRAPAPQRPHRERPRLLERAPHQRLAGRADEIGLSSEQASPQRAHQKPGNISE